MKRLFNQLLQKPPATQVISIPPTTSTKTLSPLDIPLILDLVFSYLNDHILRYKVALVCRQWFLHHQNRFSRTIAFSDFWSEKQVAHFLTKLPGAGRLECVLNFDSLRGIDTVNIRAVLARYQRDYQTRLEQMDQVEILKRKPTLYSFGSLKAISIYVAIQYDTTIDSIPFPPSLTSLELTFVYSRSNGESLGKIMRTCPLLEVLSMEVEERTGQPLSWITLEQEHQPKPLPLQHLKLRNVSFAQADLENLLSFTPQIKSLKLIGLNTRLDPEYDWTRLLEHLKALRITLEDVYFFEYGQQSHLDISPRLREICPTAWDWTLWAPDVTPSFLQELTLRTSFVTTLELFWKPRNSDYAPQCCSSELEHAPRLIHKYLCTSSQLVHLRSLKTVIRPEFMDLFNRRDSYADPQDQPTTSPLPALWLCRGLKTLHVELHGRHCSRIFFGYVSRVLPQLEELFVHIPQVCKPHEDSPFIYPVMHVHLQGGLCLLSRLKYLRRLRVASASHQYGVTNGCSKMELNWMLPSGRRDKFKRQRRAEMGKWRMMRDEEDQRETMLPSRQQLPRIEREADAEIWAQLRNLGLLLDVEEVVKEIDSGGFEPLPSLERLSFSLITPEMKHPEAELKNVFRKKKK